MDKNEKQKEKIEKKIDESIDNVVNKKCKKKMDIETKQLIVILAVLGFIFCVFIGVYWGSKASKKFEYLGLDWVIEKWGDMDFYRTVAPKRYAGTYYGDHIMYFRNDPRKNNVLVDIPELGFTSNYSVTMSPEARACSDAGLAIYNYATITNLLPFIKNISDGSTDLNNIPERMQYLTCENSSNKRTVINIMIGNQTKIYTNSNYSNCYVIEISSCDDILIASEKFALNLIKELNFTKKK